MFVWFIWFFEIVSGDIEGVTMSFESLDTDVFVMCSLQTVVMKKRR